LIIFEEVKDVAVLRYSCEAYAFIDIKIVYKEPILRARFSGFLEIG